MRLHVFSDLHLDRRAMSWTPELAPDADVIVCAGDVCQGLPEAFAFLRSFVPHQIPIITVAGNHSYYNRVLQDELRRGHKAAIRHNVTFLENQVACIGGVRFIGATLWTDFALHGDQEHAAQLALRHRKDHEMILVDHGGAKPERFTPDDARAWHHQSTTIFDSLMAEAFAGPTIVVTHHAPHPRSIAPGYESDALNPGFASDLTWLIESRQPELWIHGHIHASCDYRLCRTRVVCNPHGYGQENVSGFNQALVIEIETVSTAAAACAVPTPSSSTTARGAGT